MVRACNSAQVAASPLACQINLLTTDWERAPCLLPAGDLSLAGAENAPTPLTFDCREAQRCRGRALSPKFARYFTISPYTGRGLGLEKNFVKIKPNKPVLLNQVSVLVNCPQRGFWAAGLGFLSEEMGSTGEQLNSVFLSWERSLKSWAALGEALQPTPVDPVQGGRSSQAQSLSWLPIPPGWAGIPHTTEQDVEKLGNTKVLWGLSVKLEWKHVFFDYLTNFQGFV